MNNTENISGVATFNYSSNSYGPDFLQHDDRTPVVVEPPTANDATIAALSMAFCLIVTIGIIGNGLVILVIFLDSKMRQSVTNLFIMNLAIADLLIMLFGIPEIVQFIINRGWILEAFLCKMNRFVLVVSLYTSVLSLVCLCVERFVAIVFPIKAHIVCTRKKILVVIACIWPLSIACGLPTLIFNQVVPVMPNHPVSLCRIMFSMDREEHQKYFIIFKYMESVLFYFLPLVVQVILYAIIGKRLYASTEKLHTQFQMRPDSNCRSGRATETIRARKGVVKMLVASVLIYFTSYSPHQIHFLYNVFSKTPLPEHWEFLVFVMIITHLNSAANPILYSIFSQNFRRNFKRCLCFVCYRLERRRYRRTRFDSFDSKGVSRRGSTSKTTTSRL